MDPHLNSSGGIWNNLVNTVKEKINDAYVEFKIKKNLFNFNSEVEKKISSIVNQVMKKIDLSETQNIRKNFELTEIFTIVTASVRESAARVIYHISQKQKITPESVSADEAVMDESFLDMANDKIVNELSTDSDEEIQELIPKQLEEVVLELVDKTRFSTRLKKLDSELKSHNPENPLERFKFMAPGYKRRIDDLKKAYHTMGKDETRDLAELGINETTLENVEGHLKAILENDKDKIVEYAAKEIIPVKKLPESKLQLGKQLTTTTEKVVAIAIKVFTLGGAVRIWKDAFASARTSYTKAIERPYISEKQKIKEAFKLTTTKIALGLASRIHFAIALPFELIKNVFLDFPLNAYKIVVLTHRERVLSNLEKENAAFNKEVSTLTKVSNASKLILKTSILILKSAVGKILANIIIGASYITFGTRKVSGESKTTPPTLKEMYPDKIDVERQKARMGFDENGKEIKIEAELPFKEWGGFYYPLLDHKFNIGKSEKVTYYAEVILVQIQNIGHRIAIRAANLFAPDSPIEALKGRIKKMEETIEEESKKREKVSESQNVDRRKRKHSSRKDET